ncbi:MAG: hypothetical protein HGA45_05975 [Chloroflexales bacterium]|nr:hypothetical protein [Chloroflexales bacterium]
MVIPTRLTASALEGLPEGDGNRYERIEGELYVTTQPPLYHQVVADLPPEAASAAESQGQ